MSTELAERPEPRIHTVNLAVFPPDKPGGEPLRALVKTTPAGIVRQTLTRVRLKEETGEIFGMSARVKDPETGQYTWKTVKSITAAGYDKLNLFAGITFFMPESVLSEGGNKVCNPYIYKRDGDIKSVKVRCIGIGRNATGNLVCHDITVTYDLATYLAQDVFSKWTGKKKEDTKQWGELLVSDQIPSDIRKDPKKKAIPITGGMSLVIDLTSKDVLSIISEHINRQKFAERNAVTICRRNVLKKFFAASKLDSSLSVPVVGWVDVDRDMVKLAKVASVANEGKIIIDDEVVEMQKSSETVRDPEEVEAALHGEIDEDMTPDIEAEDEPTPGIDVAEEQSQPEPQSPPPTEPGINRYMRDLRSNLMQMVMKKKPSEAEAALRKLGLSVESIEACEDVQVLEEAVRQFSGRSKTAKKTTKRPTRSARSDGQLPLGSAPGVDPAGSSRT